MAWYANLKIGSKFNLIMSLLLISLFLVAALLTYKRQQTLIVKVAVDGARTLARQIIETRNYMSDVVRGEPENNYQLVPQVVATQVAKKVTAGSKYYVRQISLRYRNPDNRPDPYETALLQRFTAGASQEHYQIISIRGQESFRYLLPMVAEKSCLECHGTFETAPDFVRARFPRGHYSYNYKEGEVIGAVSVTIPMAELYREIGTNLKVDLTYRAVIFFVIILIMGTLIRRAIINPVALLSDTITRVTRTGNFDERLPRRGNDEIGQLIGVFNDMMEELGRKTLQSREAEDRYRKFIEMARSAVVTFMEDGKIVISNQRAEELLGLSRQKLLGESFFSFIADAEALREGIAMYLDTGKGGGVGDVSSCRVRDVHGHEVARDLALTVSEAGGSRMFTAILREPETKRS
jgi:PAS domain S-box-containing protein